MRPNTSQVWRIKAMCKELEKRLLRVKYIRSRWVEPVGEMDEVVDADMADWDGVEAVPLNPDGPQAAEALKRQREALESIAKCNVSINGQIARAALSKDTE
tara:strand:+ start:531 stop:833 length:303 start_codon:yes stop_codon:yes gene_type:complete